MSPPNFLFIVFKATSELDFGLPLLWKIRSSNPDAKIQVVYCVMNRERILRGATFYSQFFRDHGIQESDYGDCLVRPLNRIAGLLRRWSASSYWDNLPAYWSRGNLLAHMRTRLKRGLRRVLDMVCLGCVNRRGLLKSFEPCVILLALRGFYFPFKNRLLRQTHYVNCKVILYPHGSFISHGTDEIHYGVSGAGSATLPEFCSYWYSCKAPRV